ncbi:DNA primase [Thauera propionica]|uniref:DNA primase n=1 Tax=Thauera propionica TaxID=2019431 RepID=UPI0023F0F00C|nr:DNA primase [Thauera propionica]MDD3675073.1 DNA primase [Thauera propionica]
MSGRIPDDFIDAVLARTDIADVIGTRVPLRRSGRELIGRCPFHEEKTPSFTVSPQKQFYHCFGCGAHGTAIGFLMAIDRLDFREAITELAQRAGMPLPEAAGSAQARGGPPLAPLYEVLSAASAFYQKQLRRHPAAGSAVDYLKNRGLTGATAARFHLGFAPDEWDSLKRALAPRYGETLLRQAGLLTGDDDRRGYDRFRGRIVFPIEDRRGRVIGFGGRIIGAGEPKYLNSPETPVFHKGRELYGLPNVLQHARNPDALLVVEGYMDVLMLAQHGIDTAVAVLGTALTAEHLRAAFRITPRLVLCFDGDAAGRRAAERAVDTALAELTDGRELRLLFLPQGEDPDSLVRRIGRDAFLAQVGTAMPVSQYLLHRLEQQVDIGSTEGRARLSALARPLLDKLPAGLYRDLLAEDIGRLVGRPITPAAGVRPALAARGRPRPGRRPSLVRRAILLLAHYPQLAAELDVLHTVQGIDRPGMDLLRRLLDAIAQLRQPRLDHLIELWRDSDDGAMLSRILASTELAPDTPDQAAQELRQIAAGLLAQARRAQLRTLLRDASPSQLDPKQKAEVLALLNQRRQTPT